jgi:hypothetical protein
MDSLRTSCVLGLEDAFQQLSIQPERLVNNLFSPTNELVVSYKLGRLYLCLYELKPESGQPMFLVVSLLRSKEATELTRNGLWVLGNDTETMATRQEKLPFCLEHM